MTSEKDFDQLSAYLDRQLSDNEKRALEARLLAEPELKATLRDLRLQARALRDLPKLKVPRNFTLTAKQAEAIRPHRRSFFEALFPPLRLATSLSATAFVVLLTVTFLNTTPLAQPQTASVPEEVAVVTLATEAMKEASDAAPLAAETPMPELSFAAVPPTEAAGGEFGIASGSLPVTDTQNSTALVAPEGTPIAEAETAPPNARTAEDGTPEGLTGTPNQLFLPNVGGGVTQEAPPPAAPDTTPWLIGLGALTAILAALTWLARRN